MNSLRVALHEPRHSLSSNASVKCPPSHQTWGNNAAGQLHQRRVSPKRGEVLPPFAVLSFRNVKEEEFAMASANNVMH